MAETSGFWTTDDTTPVGHQVASYTQVVAAKAWAILAAASGKEGVAPDYLNGLVGSVPGANTARIGTGGAVVDGQWYENGDTVDKTIASAVGGGNTRIDRIVLRCTWTDFHTEITVLSGSADEPSPTPPAITQTPGTVYDILLYQALVNVGGDVTLTDERTMASPFIARQGGSATDWITYGTTNYRINNLLIQTGVVRETTAGPTGDVTVTFPIAFSGKPNVFAQVALDDTASPNIITYVVRDTITTTTCKIDWKDFAGGSYDDIDFQWLAIGP